MKKWIFLLLVSIWFLSVPHFLAPCQAQIQSPHDLGLNGLPASWDEGIPLGNGMLGALIWHKDSCLRISLDRADLWDLRPIKEFLLPQFSFKWVQEQVLKGTYDTVQKLFDLPYERDPAPSKIPAGALEVPISSFGEVLSVRLFLDNALCEVKWRNGIRMLMFVDANQPLGWFAFENMPENFPIKFVPPAYSRETGSGSGNSVNGQELSALGYPEGTTEVDVNSIYFHQHGWGDFSYDVSVRWRRCGPGKTEGVWSIATQNSSYSSGKSAWTMTTDAFKSSFSEAFVMHAEWWKQFWSKSAIDLPDDILEDQWYREMYKFGSASRKGAPPVTLQAVWTADNGRLPPWKGDYHNDLNTELSYWAGYSSNHLEESSVFTDWLWKFRENASVYTMEYFNAGGYNYPGVSTLSGQPMGGWIQYALSSTTSAWLAHHFYLQWKYSMDYDFLEKEAYPFLYKMACFINDISVKEGRYRKLPLSSSPEFNDNSIKAWYRETTNYDLSLVKWLYKATAEMATILGKEDDALHWENVFSEWPDLALTEKKSLMIAPGNPCQESHRHFSHLLSIYPLGLVDWHNGKNDKQVITSSLNDLEKFGSENWCGYSYAWLGNLAARNLDGEGAEEALKTFATCFCLPNSFHVNGDQSGTGKSGFTYRPFTLEGNFAFASGIQEMLLQSQGDIVRIFPAIPSSWSDVSFTNLRAQGAFLVSASRKKSLTKEVTIISEKGGKLKIENPFGKQNIKVRGVNLVKLRKADILEIKTHPGDTITLTGFAGKRRR